MTQAHHEATPDRAIRRFDVFAEYTRQERREKGDPADVAKGYGIWLAKVVASRRFGQAKDGGDRGSSATHKNGSADAPKFRSVGDELQTDETFDHDIIDRMGQPFYRTVFAPAIEAARSEGKTYEAIRDSIRKEWKPPKASSRRAAE